MARVGVVVLGAVLAAGLGSCGGGSPISSQPLAGTINGKRWAFVGGETDAFLSQGSDQFVATLYDQAIDAPCAPSPPEGSNEHLILSIPMAVGHYSLSFALNQTFSYEDASGTAQNDITTIGALDVTSITAGRIAGGVAMVFGDKDGVDGQFTIDVCAQ
jgi:hypothetical protein